MQSRIQSYLRFAASQQRDTERIKPFLATFSRHSANPYLNYAIPDDSAAPSLADVNALIAAYSQRGRKPRLEYRRARPFSAAGHSRGFDDPTAARSFRRGCCGGVFDGGTRGGIPSLHPRWILCDERNFAHFAPANIDLPIYEIILT